MQEIKEWYEEKLRKTQQEWRDTTEQQLREERARHSRALEECSQHEVTMKEQKRSLDKLASSSSRSVCSPCPTVGHSHREKGKCGVRGAPRGVCAVCTFFTWAANL